MDFWRRGRAEHPDPREVFPIEELPLEVRGDPSQDVLSACLSALERGDKLLRAGRRRDPKEDLVRRMIPILDAFDNILRHAKSLDIENDEVLENWFKAITAVHRHLQMALEREGLCAIESVGRKVDLSQHDVVEVRQDPETQDNTVVEEIEKGYRYKGRVLRGSRVVVARRPSE